MRVPVGTSVWVWPLTAFSWAVVNPRAVCSQAQETFAAWRWPPARLAPPGEGLTKDALYTPAPLQPTPPNQA